MCTTKAAVFSHQRKVDINRIRMFAVLIRAHVLISKDITVACCSSCWQCQCSTVAFIINYPADIITNFIASSQQQCGLHVTRLQANQCRALISLNCWLYILSLNALCKLFHDLCCTLVASRAVKTRYAHNNHIWKWGWNCSDSTSTCRQATESLS